MKVVLKPYYQRNVDPEEPFKKDFFARKDFANNLTTLFKNTIDPLVLTINAEWGEGKTNFIKLWEMSLSNDEDVLVIYYDAFSNDFSNDVFFSIAVTIQESINNFLREKGIDPDKSKKVDFLKESAIELGQELLNIGSSSVIKLLSLDTIDIKSFNDSLIGIKKEYKELKGRNFLDEKFDSFLNLKKFILQYQNRLSEVLGDVEKKKIIFLVDELDRCRPNFAVEVIEKIKHLFNIPNVNFVLAINKIQLQKTISNVYGVGENEAKIYLQKFVHIETHLPKITALRGRDRKGIRKFIKDISESLQIPKELIQTDKLYILIDKLINSGFRKLNPRSIERTMSLVAVAFNSCSEEKGKELSNCFLLLAFFKVNEPEVYQKIKQGKIFESSFLEDSRKGKVILHFLIEDFFNENEFVKNVSNMMFVDGLKEASRILDIYHFPIETKIEDEIGEFLEQDDKHHE